MGESTTDKPRVEPKKKYAVNVMIPPECLDEDGKDCPHTPKKEKKHYNPV